MRLLRRDILEECSRNHAEVRKQLAAWRGYVERSHWKEPTEVIESRSNVENLGNNRFKFDIKGNKYRIVVRVDFDREVVEIRFADTHDNYNKIDALTV